jgi:hypothetical protein
MYLAGDYIHPTPHRGSCRVRIYRPDLPVEGSVRFPRDEAVVICTELEDNPGMSITNSAERIAGEVISFHRLPTPLIWVEQHEDRHTFDLLTFESYEVEHLGQLRYLGEERKRIGEALRKPLDRPTVEALVGSAVL